MTSASDKPAIAITMGDPCGIGPEVVVKALSDQRVYVSCRPLVVGNVYAMQRAVELTGLPLRINESNDPGGADAIIPQYAMNDGDVIQSDY